MSAHFDVEKDNARFLYIFRRFMLLMTVLLGIYLAISTYGILKSNPGYFQNWRGSMCIFLAISVFLLYGITLVRSLTCADPMPVPFALGIWLGMYCLVLGLSLIDRSFIWYFSIVFSVGVTLFVGWWPLLTVSILALTLFAFEGLLIWPPSSDALLIMVSQLLPLCSFTGFIMLFQRLTRERFERNGLVKELGQRNSELEELHRQLAQSVVQEQELAVLRERTRLAREMHDTIGHALVLISVKLEAAQRLRERDPKRCDRELEATKQVARETMSALRASIANLRSPILEQKQISQALSGTIEEFTQRTGLHITYLLQTDIDFLPEASAETLWKVSQEALTNIEKHAHANHVQVTISRQDQKLLLSIHDDGIGLPQTIYNPQQAGVPVYSSFDGHYGLRGMFERVEAIGGRLTLHSDKEQGTTIEAELPLVYNEALHLFR